MSPLNLRFYTRENCELCDSAWAVLERVKRQFFFTVERVDIDLNPSYSSAYRDVIPVITVLQKTNFESATEVEVARSFVDEKGLRLALQALQK